MRSSLDRVALELANYRVQAMANILRSAAMLLHAFRRREHENMCSLIIKLRRTISGPVGHELKIVATGLQDSTSYVLLSPVSCVDNEGRMPMLNLRLLGIDRSTS